jgi:hypothetical protein
MVCNVFLAHRRLGKEDNSNFLTYEEEYPITFQARQEGGKGYSTNLPGSQSGYPNSESRKYATLSL